MPPAPSRYDAVMPVFIALVNLAIFVVSLVDIIRIDTERMRYLPKLGWILVVILLPFLGSILWWAIGRQYEPRSAPQFRARQPAAPQLPAPRTTEQQLADLEREEYEAQLREEIARRKRQRGTE